MSVADNEGNRSRVFSIQLLLGKTKKEYFGKKVKYICCIYVLLCINCYKEWQGSYENPSLPAKYHDNDALKC